VKVDWLKLRRKVLYCLAIFAIIIEILIKKDRPMRVARSGRRRRRSHCNIKAARGEAVIGEGRSDQCVGARRRLLPSPITQATRIGRSSLINFSLIIANIAKQ